MKEPAGPKATHVALLRGINVGRAKRVAMGDLRELVESLGYRGARTLLNSGNVVFAATGKAADAAVRIEKALEIRLGVSARVAVLTAAALEQVVAGNPLLKVAKDPSRLLVAVPYTARDLRLLEPLRTRTWTPDALAVGRLAAYAWCAAGVLESPLSKELGRVMKDSATTRNWATMLKLRAMFS